MSITSMARSPELEPPGSESLNEKDRTLNKLSRQFELISHELQTDSNFLIKMADSEIPEEHAEVRTAVLHRVKEELKMLNQLVLDIERTEGIIDVTPERKLLDGDTPQIVRRRIVTDDRGALKENSAFHASVCVTLT